MFFQLDHEAFFTLAKIGPHNVMFYDMIRGQCDRLLCSVQKKEKKRKKKVLTVTDLEQAFHELDFISLRGCVWMLFCVNLGPKRN